ncbi:uncharacterized protein TNCV_5102741 [Trichonephila clavipes]|nr:uncharacterized protein TNCV_5102741 [Trichonephila clavipes]
MIKLHHPSNLSISGPSQSGKTSLVQKLISEQVYEVPLKNIVWCFKYPQKWFLNEKNFKFVSRLPSEAEAAVAEWYRHRIVAGFVTSSSPVPLKTRRVGQRCTLNLSRAEMSSRWCGVVVRRGGCQLRNLPEVRIENNISSLLHEKETPDDIKAKLLSDLIPKYQRVMQLPPPLKPFEIPPELLTEPELPLTNILEVPLRINILAKYKGYAIPKT